MVQRRTHLGRVVHRGTVRFAFVGILYTSAAFAQTDAAVSTAREIAKEGLSAFDAGRFDEANEKLSRALEVVGVPTLALFTARANVKLGHLVRASELYLLATRLDPKGASESVQIQAQRDAEKERAELLPRIPRLTVALAGVSRDEVEVKLDGHVVLKALLGTAQLVDPGPHVIVAKRGNEEAKGEVVLAEREHKTTKLSFTPSEAKKTSGATQTSIPTNSAPPFDSQVPSNQPKGSTQRVVGWVSVGLGGAGLLLGGGTGAWLLAERSRLSDKGCVDNQCYSEQKADVDSFNTVRTVSTVGLIAGTALTVAGVTLLLSAPKRESSTSTAMVFGPGFASLRGRF